MSTLQEFRYPNEGILTLHGVNSTRARTVNKVIKAIKATNTESGWRPGAVFMCVTREHDDFDRFVESLREYGAIIRADVRGNPNYNQRTKILPILFLPSYDIIKTDPDTPTVAKDPSLNRVMRSPTPCCGINRIYIPENKSSVDVFNVVARSITNNTMMYYKIYMKKHKSLGKSHYIFASYNKKALTNLQRYIRRNGIGNMSISTSYDGLFTYGLYRPTTAGLVNHLQTRYRKEWKKAEEEGRQMGTTWRV